MVVEGEETADVVQLSHAGIDGVAGSWHSFLDTRAERIKAEM